MATESKTEIIRRNILDVTRKLLVEKGINNISTRMIARQVGCSVGLIYFHFKSKDELTHTLIEEGFDMLVERQENAEKTHKNPLERLAALSRAYLNFALENPEYYEIMFMLKPERMARYPAEKYRKARRSVEVVARTLKACAKENLMVVEDPYLNAHVAWSFMHGVITLIQAKRIDKRIANDTMIEAAIEQIIRMHLHPTTDNPI